MGEDTHTVVCKGCGKTTAMGVGAARERDGEYVCAECDGTAPSVETLIDAAALG